MSTGEFFYLLYRHHFPLTAQTFNRDGSAVELVGLCKSAVRWLTELREAKIFPYEGVSKTGENGMFTIIGSIQFLGNVPTHPSMRLGLESRLRSGVSLDLWEGWVGRCVISQKS